MDCVIPCGRPEAERAAVRFLFSFSSRQRLICSRTESVSDILGLRRQQRAYAEPFRCNPADIQDNLFLKKFFMLGFIST